MKWLIAGLISFYQRVISPRKGYSCAHRSLYGGLSCSEAVKRLILNQGVFASLRDIRNRFQACQNAATILSQHDIIPQRSDLDCGLSSCSGCGDFNSGGCFGGNTINSSVSIFQIIISPAGILTLLIILIIGTYWFYGRQVDTIDIKIIDATTEFKDKPLSKLLHKQLPDYQIIIDADSQKIKTNTHHNSSARDWLSFTPKNSVYASDIKTLTIINEQILKDQILEVLQNPVGMGRGQYFEYHIRKKWDFF